MRNSKKLLMLFVGIVAIWVIAFVGAYGISAFGIPFWPILWLLVLLQCLVPVLFDRYVEFNYIKKSLEEYNKKPYKSYQIPLNCQICGKTQNVDIDLSNTEYVCDTTKGGCGRRNAIYVNFMTATISDGK